MSALEDSLKSAFRHETNVILAKRGADNVAAALARDFLQPTTAGGPGDAGALEHRRACSAVTCDADWLLFWQGAYKVCLTRERSSWNHGVVCSLFMAVTVALALNKRAFRRGVGVLSLIMIASAQAGLLLPFAISQVHDPLRFRRGAPCSFSPCCQSDFFKGLDAVQTALVFALAHADWISEELHVWG